MINIFGVTEAEVYTDADAVIKKQEEYKEYIDTHIENVNKAYSEICRLIQGKDSDLEIVMPQVYDNIKVHDESKYGDEEFEPYRKNFYPINDQEKQDNEDDFEIAWKHHYAVNAHHPEHWIVNGEPVNMPIVYIIEMICDWESFKYIKDSGAKKYWEAEKVNFSKLMTADTIAKVEHILSLI